jgi:hypothetical protein
MFAVLRIRTIFDRIQKRIWKRSDQDLNNLLAKFLLEIFLAEICYENDINEPKTLSNRDSYSYCGLYAQLISLYMAIY